MTINHRLSHMTFDERMRYLNPIAFEEDDTPDIEEKKKLKKKDEKPVEVRQVKCSKCGNWFDEINWHNPASCPWCHKSRVD